VTKHLAILSTVAALTLAMVAPARAATTLNANWNTACGKSTCFDHHGVFSQTYSASDFSGPVTVDHLLMQRGVLGALDSHMFTISFMLNGQEVGTWGNFIMGGIGGDELTFTGLDFTWNPGDGDLELVLTLTPPLGDTGENDFRGRLSSPPEGDPDPGFNPGPGSDPGSNPDVGSSGGVEDQLITTDFSTTAVPEPATWALMLGGFGLMGAALRRRQDPAALTA
jgi:hypothetical protein